MKKIKIKNIEWCYIQKLINIMKENTEIRIIITKDRQIHVYKNEHDLDF